MRAWTLAFTFTPKKMAEAAALYTEANDFARDESHIDITEKRAALRQHESRRMKQQLDDVYGEEADEDAEQELRRQQQRSHRRLVEGQ